MKLIWDPLKINDYMKAKFTWTSEHAVLNHEGGEFITGGIYPARPWTNVAISQTDLLQLFEENYNGSIRVAFIGTAEDLGEKFKDVIDNHDWGMIGNNNKRYRMGKTWQKLTDSGDLRDSQILVFENV